MREFHKISLAAATALVLGASAASAEVVCNAQGDCWRTTERHNYGPELKLRVMPNDWKWGAHENDKYRWREPGRGRGYYRDGVWIEIK